MEDCICIPNWLVWSGLAALAIALIAVSIIGRSMLRKLESIMRMLNR